jgi:hypothetical protein
MVMSNYGEAHFVVVSRPKLGLLAVAGLLLVALVLLAISLPTVGCTGETSGTGTQSTAASLPVVDDATAQAATTLREFFQAWAAKDEAAFAALLTEGHQIGSWTFADLDHIEYGTVVAAPELIDPWLRGGNRGVTRDDVRCFRAPVTFYYNSGATGSVECGEELPWMWFLVRGANGKWRVDNWGA